MRAALFLLGLGVFGALAPGAREGRNGNAALEAEPLAAEQEYIAGLAQEDVPPEIRAALFNNLGLARFATERFAQADSSFSDALPWVGSPQRHALVAYNAGTAALASGDLTRAVAALRRALILDPSMVSAQVNLEIALLRQRRGDEDQQPEKPEPSPFAERLKAQADSLVERREYERAFGLMQNGLARDSTVAAFGEFIQRLGDVAEVDSDTTSLPLP
ncbi:tetratricopeptide repeat protein [Rubricoccus marinus]|uniref:Uncharacterized protein n=1 Tax=Rubricoccus marinus TaxID=716817 RepID=A0A259TYZ4_9BACT|nr:tetratricopeptide repeat protein [Rubricoccus marinus]OZC02993.1 hypothetical protein BSZ36_08420 [Rubricoccus marinus]